MAKYTVLMTVTAQIEVDIEANDPDEITDIASEALGNTDWNKLENMGVSEFDIYNESGKLIKVC